MQSNILKVNVQKKINCYLFNAYYLCIILAYENMYPWFYENYIQLYFNPHKPIDFSNRTEVWLDFYGGWTEPRKLLECTEIDKHFFANIDIIKFLEENIDKKNYIFTYFDEYFIKRQLVNNHYVHDIFVYGYNRSEKKIYVIGFDDKIQFCSYCVDYGTFEKAFYSGIEITREKDRSNNTFDKNIYCTLISPRFDEHSNYAFNHFKFLYNLDDYIMSRNSYLRKVPYAFELYKMEGNIFGLNIYKAILEYLAEVEAEKKILDFRPFHTLYEHKIAIFDRMSYISKTYRINLRNELSKYEQIVESFNYIRLLTIKYNLTKSQDLLRKQILIMNQRMGDEEEVLLNLYNKLRNSI